MIERLRSDIDKLNDKIYQGDIGSDKAVVLQNALMLEMLLMVIEDLGLKDE